MGRGSAARRAPAEHPAQEVGDPTDEGDDRRVGPGEEASIAVRTCFVIDATTATFRRGGRAPEKERHQAVGVGKLVRARGEVDG